MVVVFVVVVVAAVVAAVVVSSTGECCFRIRFLRYVLRITKLLGRA